MIISEGTGNTWVRGRPDRVECLDAGAFRQAIALGRSFIVSDAGRAAIGAHANGSTFVHAAVAVRDDGAGSLASAADSLASCEEHAFLCTWLPTLVTPLPPPLAVRLVMSLRMTGRLQEARSLLSSLPRTPSGWSARDRARLDHERAWFAFADGLHETARVHITSGISILSVPGVGACPELVELYAAQARLEAAKPPSDASQRALYQAMRTADELPSGPWRMGLQIDDFLRAHLARPSAPGARAARLGSRRSTSLERHGHRRARGRRARTSDHRAIRGSARRCRARHRARPAGVFSPDGGLIAYRSDCGGGGIFLVGATGENGRRLTNFGFNPGWFPDGSKVVFSTDMAWNGLERSSGHAELWTAELAAGKTAKLYGGDAVQPNVSPHGLRIAYWATAEGGSQRDIWTIPAGGLGKDERPVPVTQDAAIDWNPLWSPDGRFIYFLSDRNGTFNLWRIGIDERSGRPRGAPEPVTLPARAVMQFRLSQDGKRIIYMAREWGFHLERLALDPGRSATADSHEIWSGTMILDELAISRDGQWLAFSSPGKREDLYLMRSDGTGLKKLTDDAWRDRHPAFSPDGQTIVFRSDRSGRWELWTISVDGSALTQLTRTSGESPSDPLWSPDGKLIAFARGHDVQLMPMDGGRTAGSIESMPPPGPGLSFAPLAWTPDSLRLLGLARPDTPGPKEGMAYTLASKSYDKYPIRDDRGV